MTSIVRRFARPSALLALALGALLLAPQAVRAESKPIALVDSQRLAKEYGAARDASEAHKKFVQDLEREMETREKALQRFLEDLDSQKMLLGEAALQQKQQEFQKMRDEYYTFQQQAEEKVALDYKTRIGPILDQVRTIAERLGKEEGFALILDSASLTTIYIDSSVDLTDKVLAALVSGK